MIFEQGVYVIDHDPERTRGFYAQASDTVCNCSGCRNFRAVADRMPGAQAEVTYSLPWVLEEEHDYL